MLLEPPAESLQTYQPFFATSTRTRQLPPYESRRIPWKPSRGRVREVGAESPRGAEYGNIRRELLRLCQPVPICQLSEVSRTSPGIAPNSRV